MFTLFFWHDEKVYIREAVSEPAFDKCLSYFKKGERKDSVLICAFNDPSGVGSKDVFERLFAEQLCADGGYAVTRDQMREIYRQWRKCFAQGYSATDLFNAALWNLSSNPVISPEKHYTFDVRLGYLIYTDRRCLSTIGKGSTVFTPLLQYSIRAVNSWMVEYHDYRPASIPKEDSVNGN